MAPYRVHGLTRSYFTRKVMGYLDYTGRPWVFEPGLMEHRAASGAGWNGGIPVVMTPNGVPIWDSTAIIEYLDSAPDTRADRIVLPTDPTMRFLAYVLDDFSDEWFYRPAVGSRWSYPANTVTAGWQIAEELSMSVPASAAFVRDRVVETMTSSLGTLGVTPDNIDAWMNDVFVGWFEALDAHFATNDYLFGARPSMADFALFGANVAHFVGDPYCRELADEHGPNVVAHTTRLAMPMKQSFGDWDAGPPSDTLVAIVAEAGRHYLPWVTEATVQGSATVTFDDGTTADMEASDFLKEARGIMLARYLDARSPALDEVLERAGVIEYFADHTDQATGVPDPAGLPQPTNNRPYAVT